MRANRTSWSGTSLKLKSPFKWVFIDIIPSTAPKRFTSETTFSYCLLIVGACPKIPKLYGMEKISAEKVMDKLNLFKSKFGKIDEFGWWDLEKFQQMQVRSLPRRSSKKNAKLAEFISN